jgi:ferric-dicitrate binding protein FerR (iron transport regulator)
MEYNKEMLEALLSKVVRGEASEDEKKMVMQWLYRLDMPDTATQKDVLLLAKQQMLKQILEGRETPVRHLKPQAAPIWKWIGRSVAAAAAIVILMLSADWIMRQQPAERQVTKNDIAIHSGNKVKYLVLPDGSKIWLNSHSTLTYNSTSFNDKERALQLSGEAYFEVTGNASTPFTVASGNITTKVLGTEFNVQTYTDDPGIEVTLVKGSVVVQDLKNDSARRLLPQQQLYYSKAGDRWDVVTFKKNPAETWVFGNLSFKETPLQEVLEDIGHHYNVRVTLDKQIAGNKKVTATIAGDSRLEDAIRTVLFVHDLQYSISGNSVHIYQR